jgi:UDP-GlcNAc:undecaprenyl-phosphate GlcNAc-1-phosphate transferase
MLLTPLVRSLATRLGAIDQPGGRKIHTRPTPRLGGIPIFISLNLVLWVSAQVDFFHFPPGFLRGMNYGWLFTAATIVHVLGIIDDFRGLAPGVKFIFQVVAGLIVALTCCKIETISLPFINLHLGAWSIPVTVFWIVAVTNAVNLLDGLDGLAAGTSLIVCIAMFGVSLVSQNIGIALASIIFAGSILGFLRYNFHPSTIFLGDSGAYFLGFKLAILSLQSSLKGTATFAILIPIIALGLPLMDTAISMSRRLLKSLHIMEVDRRENVVKFFYLDGRSVFTADKDHIHHRLLQIGLTQKKAVIFLYAVSLILGAVAFSSLYFRSMNYALLLATVGMAAYFGVKKLGYTEVQVLSNGTLLPLFNVPVVNRRILRVFVDMAVIGISYYLAFFLRYEGRLPSYVKDYYLFTLPLVLSMKIAFFCLAGLYDGAWRYTSIGDLLKTIKAVVSGCVLSAVPLCMVPGFGIRSWAALLIDFDVLLILVIGIRCSFRILEHLHVSKSNGRGKAVLICGAGKGGVTAAKEFLNNPGLGMRPFGYLDDDPRILGKRVNGYPVLGTLDSLNGILEKQSISEVVLSTRNIPKEKLDRISKICVSHQIPLRHFQIRLEDIVTAMDVRELHA